MVFTAVIFDMDGVLIDSEYHWLKLEQETWRKLGVSDNKAASRAVQGRNLNDTARITREEFGCKFSVEQIIKEFNKTAQLVYARCQLLPGAKELLNDLKKRGVKIGLASSSPNEWINIFLRRFGFSNTFDEIASTQSLNLPGKPEPDIYLYTINKLMVKAKETVIIEDSQFGFQSAVRSGAKVVAVPEAGVNYGDFSAADLVIKSLFEPKLKVFLGL